jgi:hypothetical protein
MNQAFSLQRVPAINQAGVTERLTLEQRQRYNGAYQ